MKTESIANKQALSDAYLLLDKLVHVTPADGTSQKVVEARDAIRGALGMMLQKEKQAELDALTRHK